MTGLSRTYGQSVNAYFESNASYWNDVYHAEGVGAAIYRLRLATVLRLGTELELPNATQVLEVGCGAGLATVDLAKRGFRVHAVDSAPAMVNRTLQSAQEAGVNGQVQAKVGDAHALDYPDGMFRLVLAVGVLPWVGPVVPVLKELARVTTPGGYLILTIDNEWRLNHIFDPRCFPLLRPLRRKLRSKLEAIGVLGALPERPLHRVCSITRFDRTLFSLGLRKLRGITVGFGPFTFMGWRILPPGYEVRIHHYLQNLANRGLFALRSFGVEYVVLCQKPEDSQAVIEMGHP